MIKWYQNFIYKSRMSRLIKLKMILGDYTSWGSGPYGASCDDRRILQNEYESLSIKLGFNRVCHYTLEQIEWIKNNNFILPLTEEQTIFFKMVWL